LPVTRRESRTTTAMTASELLRWHLTYYLLQAAERVCPLKGYTAVLIKTIFTDEVERPERLH